MNRPTASLLALIIASGCSAAVPAAQDDPTVDARPLDPSNACDAEQWHTLAGGLLTEFPRWCAGQPEARDRALEWADARGLRFVTEDGNAITLKTYRRYVSEGGDHAEIHALDWRQIEELTCGDIEEMVELGEGCGVRARLEGDTNRCRSGKRMLDPMASGEAMRMGCAPYSREECVAMPACAMVGMCSPYVTETGAPGCRAASDEDCMQIAACKLEGLECRYDDEAGRCVVPGCGPGKGDTLEERERAVWKERKYAWAVPSTSASGDTLTRRVSVLLAACHGRLPEGERGVDDAFGVHETQAGLVGAFHTEKGSRDNAASVVRVRGDGEKLSFEYLATVEDLWRARWDACVEDAERCFYDTGSQTFLTGERICDDYSETSCSAWARRQEAWSHDLERDDLERVLAGHLGRCGDDAAVGVHELGGEVMLVTARVHSDHGVLLLAQRVDDSWRFDVLEQNYHALEGITSDSQVRLLDTTLRKVVHPGPFDASFRYVVDSDAVYGVDGIDGATACCASGMDRREVEVFLTASGREEARVWTPRLAVERRSESAYSEDGEEEDASNSATETAIEPIDATRWRLRTFADSGKKSARVIKIDPKSLGPSLQACTKAP